MGLPVVERNGLTEIKGLEKAPVASAADACSCCMMPRLTERSPSRDELRVLSIALGGDGPRRL